MKIRTGFVSNSSSSSFIVDTEADKNELELMKVKSFSVDEIIKYYENILKSLSNVDTAEEIMPYFMTLTYSYRPTISSIKKELMEEIEVMKNYKGKYITEAVDRDWAYENILTFKLSTFETDL